MTTPLELLLDEKREQEEEESRPPICTIESAWSMIGTTAPAPATNVILEMCVVRIEELEKRYRLELIDRELKVQCDTLLQTFEGLDVARRSKFIFQLTISKNHKVELNQLDFRRGFSYRFEKVHSLRLLYGNPVGSMQIRNRLRAAPLPRPETGVGTSGLYTLRSGRSEHGHASGSNDTPTTPTQEHEPAGCEQQRSETGVPAIVTPVAKMPAIRLTSKDDDETQPGKRSRKDTGKSLSFESPRKLKRSAESSVNTM